MPTIQVPWLLVGFVLLVLVFKVIMSIINADKGFDLTDEGCYMLWYTYPDKDPNPFYYFHKMVLGFLPFIDWNIISLRVLKSLSDLLVVGLISLVVYQNLGARFKGIGNMLFLVGVAGFGYYSTIFSRIFYEGDMSYLFTVLALSLPLLFIQPMHRGKLWLGLLFSGMFIGLLFFNKFSASVLSLVIVVALSLFITRKGYGILASLLGVCVGVLLFFVATGYSPAEWYKEYQDGYKYVIEPLGYNPLHLIIFYAVDGIVLLVMALLPLGTFGFVRLVSRKLGVWGHPNVVFTLLLVSFYILYWLSLPKPFSDAHYQYQSMLLNYWYVPMVSLVLYLFFVVGGFKQYSKEERIVMLLLLLMPLVSMVGTGTSLAVSVSAYLVPWCSILGLLLLQYFTKALIPATLLVGCLVVGAFGYFHLEHPFRLNATMAQQNVKLQGPNEEIWVDSTLATFVSNTKAALQKEGFTDNYPIVALCNMPGLVYLVGGYSPATPWYFDAEWLGDPDYNQKLHNTNCLNIGRIKQLESRPPVFLINSSLIDIDGQCLEANGFFLENDYRKVGEVYYPYEEYDRATGLRGPNKILVFVPETPFNQLGF